MSPDSIQTGALKIPSGPNLVNEAKAKGPKITKVEVPKPNPVTNTGHAKLKRDFSKTLPTHGIYHAGQDQAKEVLARDPDFALDSLNESPSEKRDSLSPESHSRRSNFKPNRESSENSSMDVEGGTPQRNQSVKRVKRNRTSQAHANNALEQEKKRKQEAALQSNLQSHRQHIKDAFLNERPDNHTVASDNLRENQRKKSKNPARRIQSILKKSKTNKRSVDTSPSRDSKRVQFNKFKQVLTYMKE